MMLPRRLNDASPPKPGDELHLSYQVHEVLETNPSQGERLIRDMLRKENFPYPVRIKSVSIVVERLPEGLAPGAFDLYPPDKPKP